MPKLKTHKTAKKRFKITGSGKVLRRRASRQHKLTQKSERRKREFGKYHEVGSKSSLKTIRRLIGV